jgi:hypothetical protein
MGWNGDYSAFPWVVWTQSDGSGNHRGKMLHLSSQGLAHDSQKNTRPGTHYTISAFATRPDDLCCMPRRERRIVAAFASIQVSRFRLGDWR